MLPITRPVPTHRLLQLKAGKWFNRENLGRYLASLLFN